VLISSTWTTESLFNFVGKALSMLFYFSTLSYWKRDWFETWQLHKIQQNINITFTRLITRLIKLAYGLARGWLAFTASDITTVINRKTYILIVKCITSKMSNFSLHNDVIIFNYIKRKSSVGLSPRLKKHVIPVFCYSSLYSLKSLR